ncbi:MAG TPA: PKD domain-containing protein [Planctomycetota bacterium]
MTRERLFLSGLLALPLLASAPLAAQAGMVLRHKKISEATSAFAGGLDPNDQMGRAVIALGDVDGDGNIDLASGAIGDDDGGTAGLDSDTGAIWIHFLNANGGVRANAKISMTAGGFTTTLRTRDQLGRSLAPLGDLDGDGVPDLAVGSARDDDAGVNRGAVYLLFLTREGAVKRWSKISDTQGGFEGELEDLDEFGRAIANLGDLDGNGVIDLAVGATGDDDGGADLKGAVWILFLNPDGTVLRHQKVSMTQGGFTGILGGGDLFGFAVASLGDVDGDGLPELAVGCPKDDDGGVKKGCVWLLFLRADGTVRRHVKISDKMDVYGLKPGDEFGSAIAGLGDVDGDGIPDMAVGAILDDGGLHDQGAVWINFLNADGTVRAKHRINDVSGGFLGGLANDDWFGASLARIPDLDGDGRPELAVGARFDDDGGINTGSIWILFLDGARNVPPTPAFLLDRSLGPAPLQVSFSDRSSAGARTWDWDFGDGTTSTQRHPTHVYAEPGRYTVRLTVGGLGGSAVREQADAVEVRVAARATLRAGSRPNRTCFTSTSLPVLGTSWTSEVDATQHPRAGLTVVYGTSAPAQGLFLRGGELLIALPGMGGKLYFSSAVPSGGGVAQHSVPIPALASLVGAHTYTQAFVLGGQLELCNAIDLVLGF